MHSQDSQPTAKKRKKKPPGKGTPGKTNYNSPPPCRRANDKTHLFRQVGARLAASRSLRPETREVCSLLKELGAPFHSVLD